MKKILVTGVFGFLGSHVAKHYKKQEMYVVGIGTCSQDDHDIKNVVDRYIISEISIDNLKELDEKFDAIIHCAGGSSVGRSMKNPTKDLLNTTLGTEYVLEYIRLYSPETKLIYTSSAAVYGDKHTNPISEDSALNPMSFYGVHKHLSEELCEFYVNRFNLNIGVLRYFSIYGPGLKKQLLWDACNKINSNIEPLTFFGTGEELRDWIEVTDAMAYIDILLVNTDSFKVLNAGTGRGINVKLVLKTLATLLGSKQPLLFNQKTVIGDPSYLCADIKEAKKMGWKQKITLEEGLERYVKWYQNK